MPGTKDAKIAHLEGLVSSQRQLLASMANYLTLLKDQQTTSLASITRVLETHELLKAAEENETKETL